MAKKQTVMVVDDEPDTVNLVKTILEREGYDIITANNGKECLEKLKDKNVDLVLLDIMMPGMSGWDVYEKIKKMYRSDLKVVFLTVLEATTKRREELAKEGIVDYITKPFDPEDLVRRIRMILTFKRTGII